MMAKRRQVTFRIKGRKVSFLTHKRKKRGSVALAGLTIMFCKGVALSGHEVIFYGNKLK